MRPVAVFTVAILVLVLSQAESARAQLGGYQSPDLVYKLKGATGRLELTTNTSRILTLDKNIPRVQVNNPDLLAVTPLSANQVQISAKKAGVTQVNLWDESGEIHTVDVLIYGDVRELEVALATQFPNSTIKVYRYSESLVLKGFVDEPSHVSQVVQLASDYAPKIINNITVGGVQQVLLKVKVMEVSRTKLRQLGVDWAWFGGGGDFAVNRVGGLINTFQQRRRDHHISQRYFFIRHHWRQRRLFWRAGCTSRSACRQSSRGAKHCCGERTTRAIQRRWRIPDPGATKLGHDLDRVQKIRHASRLPADRARQWQCPAGGAATC